MNLHLKISAPLLAACLAGCSDSERVGQLEETLSERSKELQKKAQLLEEAEHRVETLKNEFEIRQQSLESRVQQLTDELSSANSKIDAVRSRVEDRQRHFASVAERIRSTDPDFDELSVALFGVQAQLAMDGHKDVEAISDLINVDSTNGPNKTVHPTPDPPGS